MTPEFTILLIDDEPDIADILNRCAKVDFPEASFVYINSIDKATSYLEHLTGIGPRLVLLDLNFQVGSSGFDFLTFFRVHPIGRLLPVIVLTSTRDEREIKAAYLLGANAVTQKPFTLNDWKEYVKNLRTYWLNTATVPEFSFDSTRGYRGFI